MAVSHYMIPFMYCMATAYFWFLLVSTTKIEREFLLFQIGAASEWTFVQFICLAFIRGA